MQSLLYGLFSESPWNSESVQIPYKIINDSLWAKLTCFPYNNIYIICYHYTVHYCCSSMPCLSETRQFLPSSSIWGCIHTGKSDSSLALVRTKDKKVYIVAMFSHFGSFSHHTVCSGPNQLKRTKMQSRDNIRFTCWLDVSSNAFPKLLFNWSEIACGKIPTVLPEVNKDKSKMQQTAHCYYGETTVRVDFIPGHPLLHSLYIPLQAIYNFWEWSADAAGK